VGTTRLPGRSGKRRRRGSKRRSISIPNTPRPTNNLGVVYMSSGNPQLGRDAFQKAVTLDGGSAGAYLNLGRMAYSEREYAQSEVFLNKSLAVEPTNAEALTLISKHNYSWGNLMRPSPARKRSTRFPTNRAIGDDAETVMDSDAQHLTSRERCSARWPTCRRSRSRPRSSMGVLTCSRSELCSTRWRPAECRSMAQARGKFAARSCATTPLRRSGSIQRAPAELEAVIRKALEKGS